MRTLMLGGIALVLAATTATAALGATTYDLKMDWRTTVNPNGPWTLVQGATPLPYDKDWTPLSTTDPAYNPAGGRHIRQPGFAPGNGNGDFLPAFFKAAVTPAGAGFGWLKGDIVMHATDAFNGVGEGVAAVVFTSPASGVPRVSGYVYNARNIGRPQAWRVSVNGAVKASGALPGNGTITRSTKTVIDIGAVALNLGDTVTLTLYENGGAGGAGDFIGTDLKVVYP